MMQQQNQEHKIITTTKTEPHKMQTRKKLRIKQLGVEETKEQRRPLRDITTQVSQDSNTSVNLSDIFSSKKRTLADLGAANFGFVSDGDENDPKLTNCCAGAVV